MLSKTGTKLLILRNLTTFHYGGLHKEPLHPLLPTVLSLKSSQEMILSQESGIQKLVFCRATTQI
jgi:hypothetical protein